jgi:signal transduction histidine kinase
VPPNLRRALTRTVAWPRRWWARQSLRARLTLLATALFSLAVATGALLLLFLQSYTLTHVIDQAAAKQSREVARLVERHNVPNFIVIDQGGVAGVQVLSAGGVVEGRSIGAQYTNSLLDRGQLEQVRGGARIDVEGPSDVKLRVLGKTVGDETVVVYTDVTRIDDSLRILTRAALIGGPLAVLLMASATYLVVALTLRSVAALRHGAADITAAGLAEQRLPVPGSQDEIHRLAVTLNAMLDRIDSATSRQRTFVGDAAHELRSPLASARVQLEVGQRLGPEADWSGLIDDVLIDVGRLDRLVEDLLALARLDEARSPARRQPVALDELVQQVVGGYGSARVPVRANTAAVMIDGDPDSLRRVAINLINNAVRYAATEVVVDVVPDIRQGQPVGLITVVDDGPGIPDDELERVFDRFYRVEGSRSRETGGTGLGLPIVRDIVRSHGGQVQLTARPDGASGLRAVVRLPTVPTVPTAD